MDLIRNGRFTSSEIGRLMKTDRKGTGFGADAITYITEKLYAIQAGRRIDNDINSKPTSWGNFLEQYVYETYFGFSGFELDSKKTIKYEGEIEELHGFYCGSPDLIGADTVGDIKCPFTLKSYLQAYNCKDIEELRENHPSGELYYWQLISNAILLNKSKCQLAFFVPSGIIRDGQTETEIERIQAKIRGSEDKNMFWANFKEIDDFPYIKNPDTANFKLFEFEATEEAKSKLLDRVELAVTELKKLLEVNK